MELTVTYILSQVFTIVMYVFIALTYYAKDRKNVLILNSIGSTAQGISYIFLNAWTGFGTCIISLIRNLTFLLDEKINGKRENINKTDIITLVLLCVISIILSVFTYEGFFSLFSVFATMLYTYSACQKKINIYKLLGIPNSILWLIYNIYVMSIFGIILESILLICTIIGYILEVRKNNTQ